MSRGKFIMGALSVDRLEAYPGRKRSRLRLAGFGTFLPGPKMEGFHLAQNPTKAPWYISTYDVMGPVDKPAGAVPRGCMRGLAIMVLCGRYCRYEAIARCRPFASRLKSCVCNSASGIWCSIKFDRDRQTDRQTDRHIIFIYCYDSGMES